MKYTIETTEDGWVETLEISGHSYEKNWKRRSSGCYRCEEGDFTDRIIADGYAPDYLGDDLYEVIDESPNGLDMHNLVRDYLEE
jgi:hypothetical protein|nr:MAG TPA_asm: hypothetical protein [Caudoviricetes sp.]